MYALPTTTTVTCVSADVSVCRVVLCVVSCGGGGRYDGHVGKRASAFVSDTLHDRICRDPAFPAATLLPLLLPAEAEEEKIEEKKEENKPDEEKEKEKEEEQQKEKDDSKEEKKEKEEEKERSGCDGAATAATATTVEQVTDGICRAMEAGFLQTDREFIEVALSFGVLCACRVRVRVRVRVVSWLRGRATRRTRCGRKIGGRTAARRWWPSCSTRTSSWPTWATPKPCSGTGLSFRFRNVFNT
jgi:hypothetical protein